jgi:hypothetical protein
MCARYQVSLSAIADVAFRKGKENRLGWKVTPLDG